jgi:caffeoyl-CoA O-methyltransferase
MSGKYTALTDDLFTYMQGAHSGSGDPILEELREETRVKTEHAGMQISPEQGTFLTLLVAALGVREALEIGTFTGYSALCIARGLAPGGRLTCVDMSVPWTSIGKPYWERAGVADRINLVIAPAQKVLPETLAGRELDFVFIDADKTGYDAYYELVLPYVRQGGLILFDNMLHGGKVAAVGATDMEVDQNTVAIDKLNHKLASDPRVQCVLLGIADGVQVCRKL